MDKNAATQRAHGEGEHAVRCQAIEGPVDDDILYTRNHVDAVTWASKSVALRPHEHAEDLGIFVSTLPRHHKTNGQMPADTSGPWIQRDEATWAQDDSEPVLRKKVGRR